MVSRRLQSIVWRLVQQMAWCAGRVLLQGGGAAAATAASTQGAAASTTATASYKNRQFGRSAAQYLSAARSHYRSALQWARLGNFQKANDAARAAAAASDGAATAAAAGGGAGVLCIKLCCSVAFICLTRSVRDLIGQSDVGH